MMKLTTFAKFGYSARAVVYLLMGFFTLLLIGGSSRGAETDSKGALQQLLEQPFGIFLLAILAFGLISYSIWRFAQSFLDVSHLGSDKKALLKRIGYAIGGVSHALLALTAVKLIFSISGQQGLTERGVAHFLLTQPFGQFITGALALAIIGFGFSQLFIGVKNKFMDHLNFPKRFESWLRPVCQFGLIARGFVFSLIGYFFLKAALNSNSGQAGGIKKAWSVLHEQQHGQILIFMVAIGFIAFAVYGFVESVYEKQIQN